MITLQNVNGFSSNLVCALILWTSALGLLMVEFRLFLTELSAGNTSVFYFQDKNLSLSGFLPNLMCPVILWRSAYRQISESFDSYLPMTRYWRGIIISSFICFQPQKF